MTFTTEQLRLYGLFLLGNTEALKELKKELEITPKILLAIHKQYDILN